jgi:hypothetical protein
MAKKKATKKAATKKATKKTATKKTKAAKTTKKTAEKESPEEKPVKKKRKTRKKKTEEVRRKLFWGVFNHAMKRVALYDFNQRKAAEKRAKELSPEGKPPHFVQKVKEDVVAEPKPGEEAATATKVKKAKRKKGAKH